MEDRSPARLTRAPLTDRQRWAAALAGAGPIALAALVLAPFAFTGRASWGEVFGAALVYGGLLGLAAGFVYVDRVHARQCPRCGAMSDRGAQGCPACDYDLAERPRYACDERHALFVEAGLCDCGRRLHRVPVARGVGREIVWMLKVGAWLLAFLIGVGLVLDHLA